jgi:hypothetical protein
MTVALNFPYTAKDGKEKKKGNAAIANQALNPA